ncbi:uncharacterized protein LOC105839791 isoform X1 [Monomorium pharaonis]|uniref:uncharacterized protein LOC105839791 isoform X1 n=1 Tax=Monomorium pharaonis TaxID=307658 RepID=UPI001746B451|nr:uncharacterized protein LOC105839791 isoform X1 [Monomorium pharaonis]
MIVFKSWYYNANRIFLLICGLWPYQKKFRYVRAIFILGILVFYIISQFRVLFAYKYNFKFALKIFSNIFPAILCLLQFIAFLINPKEVRKLLDQISEEWNALKDSKEIEIVRRYGTFTRRLTEALLLCALLSWVFLILLYLIPISVNDSTIANESLLKHDISMQELTKEEYIFFFIVVFIGVFIMTATTSMILAYMRHICAMLKITCYRIEHSLDGNILHMSISQQNRLMCQKLVSAVNIHRRAMESVSAMK